MSQREHYRAMAADCLRRAERMRDPVERQVMLTFVGGYLKLADYVGERHEHGTAHWSRMPAGEVRPQNS